MMSRKSPLSRRRLEVRIYGPWKDRSPGTSKRLPSEFKEVSRSLLTYGLPDFTSFSLLTQEDRLRIRRSVEDAINRFEPRLLRVRVALEAPREHDRGLRFRIDAFLRVDPSPEPVTFDAVLQMNTQQYVIQREQ